MMTNYSKISDYNTNRICSLFEYSRDINYIKTMVPEFEYNMIISVLTSAGQYNDIIKDYMCQLTIKDKKLYLLVIRTMVQGMIILYFLIEYLILLLVMELRLFFIVEIFFMVIQVIIREE